MITWQIAWVVCILQRCRSCWGCQHLAQSPSFLQSPCQKCFVSCAAATVCGTRCVCAKSGWLLPLAQAYGAAVIADHGFGLCST